MHWDELQAIHLSALQEIGNIGAGNAAGALATMLNTRIDMSVPRSGILPYEDMLKLAGNEEDIVSCVYFQITGDIEGNIFFLLSHDSAAKLVEMLLGSGTGRDMVESTLKEIGNILTGNFLTSFNQFTGLKIKQSIPAFAFDMLGAVLSAALLEGGHLAEKALVIETEFFIKEKTLNGHFFLVPNEESLSQILKALGL